MATYKLDNLSGDINVQSISILSVNDNVIGKNANVIIILETPEGNKYATELYGFTYTNSWEDIDILNWANVQLTQFEVKVSTTKNRNVNTITSESVEIKSIKKLVWYKRILNFIKSKFKRNA